MEVAPPAATTPLPSDTSHHFKKLKPMNHSQSRNCVFLNTNKNHWLTDNLHPVTSLLKASYSEEQKYMNQYFKEKLFSFQVLNPCG